MAAKTKHLAGFPGGAYEAFGEEVDFTNASPMTAQVTTVTFSGTIATTNVFTVNVGDESVTFSPSAATVKAAANDLAAELNANIGIYTLVGAVSDDTDTVTLTARQPGVAITVSATTDTGAGVVTATEATAAAGADAIPFGRYILRDEVASTVTPYPNRRGRLPAAAGDVDKDKGLCISLRKYDEPGDSYAPNSRCAGMKRGSVVVRLGDAGEPVDGDEVFVGRTSTNKGIIYTTAASNSATAIDKSVLRFRKYLGDGLAVVDCNFH